MTDVCYYRRITLPLNLVTGLSSPVACPFLGPVHPSLIEYCENPRDSFIPQLKYVLGSHLPFIFLYPLTAVFLSRPTSGPSKDLSNLLVMFEYISGGHPKYPSGIDTNRDTERVTDGTMIVSTGLLSFVLTHLVAGLSSSKYH